MLRFKSFLILCLCLLKTTATRSEKNCEEKEKSLISLQIAEDLISKAKDNFPNCHGVVTNASECSGKEKAFAYLDMARTLIRETRENYPKCNEPKTKDPDIEEPVTKEPATEIPITKKPESEFHTSDQPVTETLLTKEPETVKPITKDPSSEKPVTEKPITKIPLTKKPTTETFVTKDAASEKPVTEQPKTENTSTNEPTEILVTKEPASENPSTKETTTEISITKDPESEKPVTEHPITEKPKEYPKSRDCTEVLQNGQKENGVYTIWPNSLSFPNRSLEVFCDMLPDGGGWTVIQRRGKFTPQEDFYRDWKDYQLGFGDLAKEFWLGNENIYILTNQGKYKVRFDLQSTEGKKAYAMYGSFRVEDEKAKYKLNIGTYSGNAGNCMGTYNGKPFSTKDRDDSFQCAEENKAGWWYSACTDCNLNGVYKPGQREGFLDFIFWYHWQDSYVALDAVEIKIKSVQW